MSVPARRIVDPIFGKPLLRKANNGTVAWTQINTNSQWQKGTGWQAQLYGGAQTGNDDWAAMFIPVSELRLADFDSAMWAYYMTNAETMGINIVLWVHDPNDFSKRAEITQLANISGLGKASGWNKHTLVETTDQFFFYGESTTGTGLTAGPTNLYGLDDFKADALFKHWTIYRISFEYGWDASGTFENAWLVEVKLNNTVIPIMPSVDERISRLETNIVLAAGTGMVGKVQPTGEPLEGQTPFGVTVGNTTTAVLAANASRKAAIFVNDSNETIYLAVGENAVMNNGIRLNAHGGSFVMSSGLLSLEAVNGICSSGGKVCSGQEFEAA